MLAFPCILILTNAFCGQPTARAICDTLDVLDRVTCADPQFYFLIGGCALVLSGLTVTALSAALIYRNRLS